MDDGTGGELTLDRDDGAPTRPRALWGAVAALAVLAGTLAVVAAGGAGDDDMPVLPVGLGEATGGAERSTAADATLAAWMTFVAGEGLHELGGEAPAYELVGELDADRVAALASALGLSGEPQAGPDGAWRVETPDGALEVDGPSMGGTWWFSRRAPDMVDPGSSGSSSGGGSAGCEPGPATDCGFVDGPAVGAEECTVSQEPDGTTSERCVSEPVPSVDLPSQEEARRAALDLLAAIGVDLDGAVVTVDGPYDAWYVRVEPLLDGVPAGWISDVGVGPEGVILHAAGRLARAERLGDYPLIDTRAAIDRLNAPLIAVDDTAPMPLPAPEPTALPDRDPDAARCTPQAPDCEDTPTASAPCGVQADDGSDDCAATPTTSVPCAVQPDGREICEVPGTAPFDRGECVGIAEGDDPSATTIVPPDDPSATTMPPPGCVEPAPPVEPQPDPAPEPLPEPDPIEVVLTGVERVLIFMPAIDGSDGTYLVPGYRFTSDDGQVFDVPAVADELLSSPNPQGPDVTAAPVPPDATPTDPACEPLVEDDGSGTTHTVVPPDCGEVESSDPEMVHLDDGATPEIGVPYYVDVDTECGAFELGGQIWMLEGGSDAVAGWSSPHEGGRFTLDAPDHGTFVGDAAATKTATFATGIAGNGCMPTPRG